MKLNEENLVVSKITIIDIMTKNRLVILTLKIYGLGDRQSFRHCLYIYTRRTDPALLGFFY